MPRGAASAPTPTESDRVALARVAIRGALAVAHVVDAVSGDGRAYVTRSPSEDLEGVIASADGRGRYELSLRLIAELVPLEELAEKVRARVRSGARRRKLESLLGAINVEFVDLADVEAPARARRPAASDADGDPSRPDAEEAAGAGRSAGREGGDGAGEREAPDAADATRTRERET